MVRSLSVWVLLASTGLAVAQSPVAGPTVVTDGAGASLTVHEQGRQANKCKVLKTWLLTDGSRAFQAQSVISGEIVTIVESGPPDAVTPDSKIEARATHVYHWNGSQAPPPGTPLPPDGHLVPGLPSAGAKMTPGVATTVHTTFEKGQLVTTVSTDAKSKADEQQMLPPAMEPLPAPSDAGALMPTVPSGLMPVGFTVNPQPVQPTPAAQAPAAPSVPYTASKLPPGAGSVMASGGAQYLPVPIVTVPDFRHMPLLPQAQMPQPPQPTGAPVYVPPQQPANPYGPNFDMNAFSPAGPQLPPSATSNGFGPVGPGMPEQQPAQAYGAMPQGYPQQPPVARPPVMPQQPAMPNAAMQQAMQQVAMQAAMQQAAMQQAAIQQPTQPAPVSARTIDPGLQRQANAAAPQSMHTLRHALLPSEREMAVSKLVYVDWKAYPTIVQALVTAAHDDPAASVRAACVRAMAHMNINTVPVYTALQSLRNDGDPRVMQEVEQALATLAPGLDNGPAVQPAGGMMPR